MRRFSNFIRFSILSGLALSGSLLTSCASTGGPSDYSSKSAASIGQVPELTELRGVWITNVDSDVLTSKKKIVEMMDFLAENNLNVVYPVVWNKARTLYPSDVMEAEFGIRIDPLYGDRDPLQELIVEAHARGIEVVPWFEFGFASSYNTGGGHILEKKPEWKALDQDGNLAKKNSFEWMNGFHPDVQNFMTSLVLEVCKNYDIDGIQGDDRLPAMPHNAGYDNYTMSLYKAEFGTNPPRYSGDKPPQGPGDEGWEEWKQWVQFRADILTEFLRDLRREVKAVDENIMISSSPSYYDWALYQYHQDSYAWTNEGLVDSIHPQAYRRPDVDKYKLIVDDLVDNQFTAEQLEILSPGILLKVGDYVASPEYISEAVDYNRANGIKGEVYFFYPGLRENNDQIGNMLGEQFYTEPARLHYRDAENTWRPEGIMSDFPVIENPAWATNSKYPGMYRRAGGTPEQISWDIRVPKKATYDIFVKSLTGPEQTTGISYRVNGSTTTFDQANGDNTGWIHIGQAELKSGKNREVVTLDVTETDPKKFIISGPIMALLNRKASPDVVWE